MNHIKRNRFFQYLTFLSVLVFVFVPVLDGTLFGSQPGSSTRMSHTKVDYFVPGSRIQVKALISDGAGIMLARCYFRLKGQENYYFIEMPLIVGNEYVGILPAPSATAQVIEYILLAVNQNGTVVRSQVFEMRNRESRGKPSWQEVDSSGSVMVKSELAQAPQSLAGFSDRISADVIESVFRFGYVVEGIYKLSQMVGAAPVGAVSGGTVSATTTKPTPQTKTPVKTTPRTPPRIPDSSSQPQKKKKGISPVLLIGGGVLVVGGVLVATGALGGAKKLNVTITVRDGGDPRDDDFDVFLDGEKLGATTGSSGSWTEKLKEGSSHTLKVTLISNSDSYVAITISNSNRSAETQEYMTLNSSLTVNFTVNTSSN
ncbi:hypothetical protein ACFLT9_02075 [Acidobacteriota bacterium]